MKSIRIILVAILLISTVNTASAVKTLYLVRHAKSSHDDPTLKDFDRPLAERGHKDAPKVGKRLKKAGVQIDHVLSSPSKRTKQTSKYICDELGYDYAKVEWEQSIYRCSSTALRIAISKVDDQYSSLMVFGHNPATTSNANFFQSDTTFDNVPTTGTVAIEFDIDSWADVVNTKGKFLFFEYPKRKF